MVRILALAAVAEGDDSDEIASIVEETTAARLPPGRNRNHEVGHAEGEEHAGIPFHVRRLPGCDEPPTAGPDLDVLGVARDMAVTTVSAAIMTPVPIATRPSPVAACTFDSLGATRGTSE